MRHGGESVKGGAALRRHAGIGHRRVMEVEREIRAQYAMLVNICQQPLVPWAEEDVVVRDARPCTFDTEMQHEKAGGPALLRQFFSLSAPARMLAQQEMSRLTAPLYTNLEDAARSTTLTLNREVDGVVTPKQFQTTTTVAENADETLKDIAIEITYEEQNETKKFVVRTRMYRSE